MNSDKHPANDSTNAILTQLKDIASAVMYAAEAGKLETVFERIAQVSKDLVNARYAALGIPDENGDLKYFKVAGMSSEAIARMEHLPRGRGLLGAITQERQSIRLARMQDDPRSAGFCRAHPVMTSFLGVPIQVGQQLLGILYLSDRVDGQPFSEQDQWLVETMAGYAALAIAGSQLSEQQSRLALLEERERISMELHDGVIQSLYAIGMNLDMLRLGGSASGEDLRYSIHSLNAVIEDIRRYIMDLRRGEAQKTIRECLQDMVSRLNPPSSLRIELNAPYDKPLFTPATFEAICQMANEAVSNALRHAEATHLQISALQNTDLLQITIADNGKGFDSDGLSAQSGLGLRNIQQRAAMHGGQITIETAPGEGTRLTIIVPARRL